jgi:hypothetical protein
MDKKHIYSEIYSMRSRRDEDEKRLNMEFRFSGDSQNFEPEWGKYAN